MDRPGRKAGGDVEAFGVGTALDWLVDNFVVIESADASGPFPIFLSRKSISIPI